MTELLAGEVPDGEAVTVSMSYGPAHQDAGAYDEAVVAGAPVVVFASAHPDVPGGLVASAMEGFMTACEAGSPLGWLGTRGGWADIDTLGDVARAVRDPDAPTHAELDGSLDCAGDLARGRVAGRVDGNGDYDTIAEAVERGDRRTQVPVEHRVVPPRWQPLVPHDQRP